MKCSKALGYYNEHKKRLDQSGIIVSIRKIHTVYDFKDVSKRGRNLVTSIDYPTKA